MVDHFRHIYAFLRDKEEFIEEVRFNFQNLLKSLMKDLKTSFQNLTLMV